MNLIFLAPDGTATHAEGHPGERLLDAAQRAGQPLEGTCGGGMACGTCHVLVAEADVARLPPPSGEEEDLLDLIPQARRTSRLACQIVLADALEGLTVRVPG